MAWFLREGLQDVELFRDTDDCVGFLRLYKRKDVKLVSAVFVLRMSLRSKQQERDIHSQQPRISLHIGNREAVQPRPPVNLIILEAIDSQLH